MGMLIEVTVDLTVASTPKGSPPEPMNGSGSVDNFPTVEVPACKWHSVGESENRFFTRGMLIEGSSSLLGSGCKSMNADHWDGGGGATAGVPLEVTSDLGENESNPSKIDASFKSFWG